MKALETVLPDGETEIHEVKAVADETGFFEGIFHHMLEWKNPAAGKWKVSSRSSYSTPYGLAVFFDSPLNTELYIRKPRSLDEAFAAGTAGAQPEIPVRLSAEWMFFPEEGASGQRIRPYSRQLPSPEIRIPDYGEGTYNVTLELEGDTPGGARYQRTLVQSAFRKQDGRMW